MPRPLAVITFSDDPPKEVLDRIMAAVEEGVKTEVNASTKKPRSRLADSIKVYQKMQGIVIDSDVNYARIVNEGRGPSVMRALIGRVVPIKLTSGITIFRRVTEKAIREGKWSMPGMPGKDFVRRGVQRAVSRSGGLMTRYGYDLNEDITEVMI